MRIDICPMTDDSVQDIARFMAASFQNDPLYCYFVPEREGRMEFMKEFFSFRLRYARSLGKVYMTEDKLAVAAWIPPDVHMSPEYIQKFGGMEPILAIGEKNSSHVMDFADFSDAIEQEFAPMPHWHLSPIAVAPGFWGKGYANALIQPMMERFDRTAQYCYLETHTTKNRDIYKRYGFTVVKEDVLPHSNIAHYSMLRTPIPVDPYM